MLPNVTPSYKTRLGKL